MMNGCYFENHISTTIWLIFMTLGFLTTAMKNFYFLKFKMVDGHYLDKKLCTCRGIA